MHDTDRIASVMVAGSNMLCVNMLVEYLGFQDEVGRVMRVHSLSEGQESWEGDPPDVVFIEGDSCDKTTSIPGPLDWRIAFPSSRVIVFAHSGDEMDTVHAIERGACGFADKNDPPRVFLERVQQVMRGEPAVAPKVQATLVQRLQELSTSRSAWQAIGAETPSDKPLTGRELEVLRLLAEGMTNRQAALNLGLSESTVKNHVSNLFSKLDVNCRSQAINVAIRQGILRF